MASTGSAGRSVRPVATSIPFTVSASRPTPPAPITCGPSQAARSPGAAACGAGVSPIAPTRRPGRRMRSTLSSTTSRLTCPARTAAASWPSHGPSGPGMARSSPARAVGTVLRAACQSDRATPRKPHSSLRMRASSGPCSVMVTPLTLLYPVITRSTSASRTGLEGDQVQLTQHTLGDPGVIGPALRLGVVAHEVLDRRGRPGLVQAADERAGHPGDQHRVLAERLEAPAAERRAHDVDRRAQQDVDALAPGLGAERSGERLDQGWIPGGAEGRRAGSPSGRRGKRLPEGSEYKVPLVTAPRFRPTLHLVVSAYRLPMAEE